jgi:glutaminyl-tRNA synthetase
MVTVTIVQGKRKKKKLIYLHFGLLLLLLLLLLDAASASFAYAPNFITKIVQEQTGITPAPGALLQVLETQPPQSLQHQQHQQQQQQQHADAQQEDEEERSMIASTAATTVPTTTTTTTTTRASSSSMVVRTRFPPEPNGYLHLGHAKAICFNFAVARMFGGTCHMRMDDTNPAKEDEEYVTSILDDVIWIQQGLFEEQNDIENGDNVNSSDVAVPWDGPVRKTSDYFETIYKCAVALIQSGDAYVDSLSAEEMKEYRGTLTEPGRESPDRNRRSIAENLQLFTDMRNGKYNDGEYVLRAKIDMTSPNVNLRDPVLYRIKHESHQETGDTWCIYPMYDFSHPIADAVEGISHSLCTLEFEDHRPLYDWTLQKLWPTGLLTPAPELQSHHHEPPQQIEFSRLNVKSTVLSKRKLIQLAESKSDDDSSSSILVQKVGISGWDDPRLPTLCGLRRRGIPPAALRLFCERVGISKADSNIDYSVLEDCVRECMDVSCPRAFCILEPLRVTISNWDEYENENIGNVDDSLENFTVPRHPKVESMGQRTIPFGKRLFIERSDFFDADGPEGQATGGKPPKGFKRLLPHGKDGSSSSGAGGGRVRLRFAYVVECQEVVRDATTQEPIELKCKFLPETRAGVTPDGMARVDGIIHWVEASTAVKCRVNQYDRLFLTEEPGKESGDFLQDINPASLQVLETAVVEPSVAQEAVQLLEKIAENSKSRGGGHSTTKARIYPSSLAYQFERSGYFALDKESTGRDNLVFNRVVTLRDTWGVANKEQQRQGSSSSGSQSQQRSRGGGQQGGGGGESNADQEPLEEIRRVALRAGTILSATPHPEADSLLVCKVDCGDVSEAGNGNAPCEPRTIVAGLAGKIPIEDLVGRKVVTVTNLKPAKMRGIESTAMLLAASNGGEGDDERVELLDVPDSVPNGELVSFEGKEPSQPDTLLKSKGALKAWERVKACLRSNSDGEATYKSEDSVHRMITSGGPVKTASLKKAVIQ